MRYYLIIISIVLTLVMNSVSGQTGKTERPGEPDIYSFKSSDKEMNEAIKTAKLTLKEFNTALLSRNKNFRSFALKVRFPTSKGSEHIWLSSISFKQNKYSGIVDDVPEAIPNMKMGDTIQIPIDNISDWLYLDKNKLRGGYTIRVIRNHLTEPERKKFDSENNFVIED